MLQQYDVVIIGGGVTGCSAATFLAAEPGFDGTILIVERDPTYQSAPSAKATGGFRQQFSTPENIQMGLFGVRFLKKISHYLSVDGAIPDVGFHENGYLLLATASMLPVMRENNALQRDLGADIHFRMPVELQARYPWLATDGIAGGFLSDSMEGYLDAYSLLQAFRRKARALGVTFIKDEAVSLHAQAGRLTGIELAGGGTIACAAAINTAGASGARELCTSLGVPLPVESRKRCTFVFDCRTAIGPTPLVVTETGVGFRSEGRGFIAVCAPSADQDPDTRDSSIDYNQFDDVIWPALAARVPAFEAIRLTGAWSCHYDFNTLDENLIIGSLPGYDNAYVAAGFSGHGLQQSPAVGRALSELVTFGEYRTLDLSRFGYERVLTGNAIREMHCY